MLEKDLKQQRVLQHLKHCKIPFTAHRSGVVTTSSAVLEFQENELRLVRKGVAARKLSYSNLNIDRLIGLLQ